MSHRYLIASWLLLACGSGNASDTESERARDFTSVGAPAGGGTGMTSGTSNGAAASVGGGAGSTSGGVNGAAASAGASASAAGESEVPSTPDADASFQAVCSSHAETSCEQCLCTACTSQLEQCQATPGCPEITECIREQGCEGISCYCGQFDALTCLAGEADGPCKATILAAPGGRAPTLSDPSGGPASDAALAIGDCQQPGKSCATACGSAG